MSKIDIDRFICTLLSFNRYGVEPICFNDLITGLQVQGLTYRNGEIVEIAQPPLTEEQKPVTTPGSYDMKLVSLPDNPHTIKFNEPMTNAKKKYFDSCLFNDVRYKPIDFDKIDIEKMVKEYRESLNSAFLPLGYYPSQLNEFTKVYKRGLEDILKVIKGGD